MSKFISRELVLLIVVAFCGCEASSKPSANEPVKKPRAVTEKPKPEPESEPVKVEEPKPDPVAIWKEQFDRAQAAFEKGELDETERLVAELKKSSMPGEEQNSQLADLEQRIADKREAQAEQARQAKLAAAQDFLDRGKLAEATQAVNEVLARAPTDEQREQAAAIAAEVERRRKARRDLQSWLQLLASEERAEVVTAQNQLSKDPDTAAAMLQETIQQTDQPTVVRNSLELLRLLDRPKMAVPAYIEVLNNSQRQANWPDAIRELSQLQSRGAGELVLQFAVSAQTPEQRLAGLTALSQIVDPPQNTVVALLPLLNRDGPELAQGLRAALHAVRTHQQFDLASRRGMDFELTDEQDQVLNALPTRLAKLAEAGAANDAGYAALVLAHATRQLEAKPLPNVKVVRAHAELPDGPAAAVVDGIWNAVELAKMWRHPVDQQSLIVLDLGETRTVTGVRIWNFNEPGATYRGWKDVDVYVGDTVTELRLVSRGVVPMAPGAANTPDYSAVIPIDFARTRYVRLVGVSQWRKESHTGLSEVQILGF